MDHRLFAALTFICFGLEGAGCASKSARARQDVIVMPMQTGSTLQRRVLVTMDPGDVTEKPKKKKERTAKKPSVPEQSPEQPEEESPAAPDRFR